MFAPMEVSTLMVGSSSLSGASLMEVKDFPTTGSDNGVNDKQSRYKFIGYTS